jgi:hypothetical protein
MWVTSQPQLTDLADADAEQQTWMTRIWLEQVARPQPGQVDPATMADAGRPESC